MAEFIEVASQFGVPVAVMVAMGVFFVAIARWFRPRADQLIDAHLDLVKNIKECNSQNADSVSKNVAALRAMAEKSVCQFNAEAAAQKIVFKAEKQAERLIELAAEKAESLLHKPR